MFYCLAVEGIHISFFLHERVSGYKSRGFALKGEVLFFAPPKKSTQKKRGPDGLPAGAGSLCFSVF